MPAVRAEAVREALRPRLGAALLAQMSLAGEIAETLRRFTPGRDDPEALHRRLCDMIFGGLYALLGPRMSVRLDDGRQVRVLMEDIPTLADAAMGALFDSLPADADTLAFLREYAMRAPSPAAMRALLTRFPDRLPGEEQALLRRILRDSDGPASP